MSRKYGQRGYQEGERERREPPRREPPPPRHSLDRPRGRGLGAPTEEVFRCAVCGAAQAGPAPEDFAARCEKCQADLHTCTNCGAFDTAARWECRRWQERSGPVLKKSKANDCTLMTAKVGVETGKDRADPSDPRAAFDALFKL